MTRLYKIILKSGKEILVSTPSSPIANYCEVAQRSHDLSRITMEIRVGNETLCLINMGEIAAIECAK